MSIEGKKISELGDNSPISGEEFVAIVQDGVNKKAKLKDVLPKSGGGGVGKKDENTVIPPGMGIPDDKKDLAKGEIFNATEEITMSAGGYTFILPPNDATGIFSHAEGNGATASGLASHAEGNSTTASGNYSHAEGSYTTASETDSHAEGGSTTASGNASHAEGTGTTASETDSHAEGNSTTASGFVSHAEGGYSTASGEGSHAEGGYTTASGDYSHAQNRHTEANGFAQTAIGYKNVKEVTPRQTSYDETKLAFVVGANNKNAFEVYFNGEVKQNGTSVHPGADYAEMFEYADGNASNEDRIGRFVTLNGDKIELATKDSTYILGIVSGNPVVLGDEPMEWHGKYINDEWNRPVYNYQQFDIEKQVKNPKTGEIEKKIETRKLYTRRTTQNFDEALVYKSRRERKEWDAVGLLGKLLVLQDGTLQAGSYCYPSVDGIATKSEKGYYVMKVINDKQALVLFK